MRPFSLALAFVLLAGCAPRQASDAVAPSPVATEVPPATVAIMPTAAAAPVTPAAAPDVQPPPLRPPLCQTQPRPIGDVALVAFCPAGADLRLDARLPDSDVAEIGAQVEDDLAAVQREFAWTLRSRAVVYVLADRDAYVAALETLFGYAAVTAEFVADNSVAFFEPSLRLIAVNWDAVRDRRPIAAIRHELTHVVTLEVCAPRCDLVPAWLNEGQARLAEATIPGADWRMMRVRYEAASMATTNTLLPLTSLWTQAQWNAYGDWLGYYKYQEAARATQLLREDIGADPMPRLYARLRAGTDFASAYAALSGKSFASFTAALESRIVGDLPARGIVTATPGADGGGGSFLVYGFPAEATITVRVRSHAVDETQTVSVSPQGAWFGSIDESEPRGIYTITAASGDAVAAVTFVKCCGRAYRAPVD